jgi:hypothetical protein
MPPLRPGTRAGHAPCAHAGHGGIARPAAAQVSVAILLDSFITARAASVEMKEQAVEAQLEDRGTIRSVLDPLLERLTRDYHDDADLAERLEKLFKVRRRSEFAQRKTREQGQRRANKQARAQRLGASRSSL